MGNCCATPVVTDESPKPKKGKKPNPFALDNSKAPNLTVLKDPTGHEIANQYSLGQELGRGEFGITYLCTDKMSGDVLACKSISKYKLRTVVDIEDVRREVEIMRHLLQHVNVVSLKLHLVMELCEGGELFDRIVARGHYTERAAADVTRTIAEVVHVR